MARKVRTRRTGKDDDAKKMGKSSGNDPQNEGITVVEYDMQHQAMKRAPGVDSSNNPTTCKYRRRHYRIRILHGLRISKLQTGRRRKIKMYYKQRMKNGRRKNNETEFD